MMKQLIAQSLPVPLKDTLHHLYRQGRDAIATLKEKTFRPYVTPKTIDDITFAFLIGDRTGQLWYDSEWEYSATELSFLREHLIDPGDTIFDCGGHHGWNAILLSHYVGSAGRVVTFEPNPTNCDIIRRNMALNGIQNVQVEHLAIGPHDQHAVVTNMSDTIVKPERVIDALWPEDCRRRSVRRGIEVRMESLDTYIQHHGVFPQLLKIDVEGYEIEVLRGGRQLLARHPKLCLEVHHPDALARYGTSVEDLFELLPLKQYTLWAQVRDDTVPFLIDDLSAVCHLGRRFHLYAAPKTDR